MNAGSCCPAENKKPLPEIVLFDLVFHSLCEADIFFHNCFFHQFKRSRGNVFSPIDHPVMISAPRMQIHPSRTSAHSRGSNRNEAVPFVPSLRNNVVSKSQKALRNADYTIRIVLTGNAEIANARNVRRVFIELPAGAGG